MGIRFSDIIERININLKGKIKEPNDKFKRYCERSTFVFVDNDSTNKKYLSKSLLLLNKTGQKIFSRNLLNCLVSKHEYAHA